MTYWQRFLADSSKSYAEYIAILWREHLVYNLLRRGGAN